MMRSTSLLLIWIMLLLSSWKSDSTIAPNQDEVIDQFFNSLPTKTDTANVDPLGVSDGDEVWREFIAYEGGKALNYLPPNVESFINRKLVWNNDTIAEIRHPYANERIGYVTCEKGKPVILYAIKIDNRITPGNFTFFREHEYAHIRLGHASCNPRTQDVAGRQREFDADCEAVKYLENSEDGRRVIDRAIGTLLGINKKKTKTHPSTRERAEAIDKDCH